MVRPASFTIRSVNCIGRARLKSQPKLERASSTCPADRVQGRADDRRYDAHHPQTQSKRPTHTMFEAFKRMHGRYPGLREGAVSAARMNWNADAAALEGRAARYPHLANSVLSC